MKETLPFSAWLNQWVPLPSAEERIDWLKAWLFAGINQFVEEMSTQVGADPLEASEPFAPFSYAVHDIESLEGLIVDLHDSLSRTSSHALHEYRRALSSLLTAWDLRSEMSASPLNLACRWIARLDISDASSRVVDRLECFYLAAPEVVGVVLDMATQMGRDGEKLIQRLAIEPPPPYDQLWVRFSGKILYAQLKLARHPDDTVQQEQVLRVLERSSFGTVLHEATETKRSISRAVVEMFRPRVLPEFAARLMAQTDTRGGILDSDVLTALGVNGLQSLHLAILDFEMREFLLALQAAEPDADELTYEQ